MRQHAAAMRSALMPAATLLLLAGCGSPMPRPDEPAGPDGASSAMVASPSSPTRPGCGELMMALYAPMVELVAHGPSLFAEDDGAAKLAAYRSKLAEDLAALALGDPELKDLADDYREAMSRLAGELAAVAAELRVATERGDDDALGAAMAHYQQVDDSVVEQVDARYRLLCEGGITE